MREDVDARLVDLRRSVESARSMPMSASVMLNRSELLGLVTALEDAIAGTISTASEVVDDRDAVVASGRSTADDIVRAAEIEREQLISDTDVYRLAAARSAEITATAEQEADELRKEADEYVEATLANFELTLERTIEVVRRGRARLSGGHSHALGDNSDVEDIDLPDHLR